MTRKLTMMTRNLTMKKLPQCLAVGCVAAATLALTASPAAAAVTGISSITTSPSLSAADSDNNGEVDTAADVTSINLGSGSLSVATGATSTSGGEDGGLTSYWAKTSADLADPNATGNDRTDAESAVLGTTITDGLLNDDGGDANFNFGRDILASEWIFITDLETNDTTSGQSAITIQLLDGSSVIGDLELEVITGDWGGALFDELVERAGGSDLNVSQFGVAFKLSDFTGTTGDASTADGIRILGGTGNQHGLDPSVVGLAVPEPASLALVGIGSLLILGGRRRHSV